MIVTGSELTTLPASESDTVTLSVTVSVSSVTGRVTFLDCDKFIVSVKDCDCVRECECAEIKNIDIRVRERNYDSAIFRVK